VTLSSGRTVAVGAALAVAAGAGFGLTVGVGDSSEVPGVLARNGVEAASCAQTHVVTPRKKIAKTNERMWVFLRKILPRR
jgi:hypothetical protein